MYQNELLQETRDYYLPLEDHQLFPITLKAGCINKVISGKIA